MQVAEKKYKRCSPLSPVLSRFRRKGGEGGGRERDDGKENKVPTLVKQSGEEGGEKEGGRKHLDNWLYPDCRCTVEMIKYSRPQSTLAYFSPKNRQFFVTVWAFCIANIGESYSEEEMEECIPPPSQPKYLGRRRRLLTRANPHSLPPPSAEVPSLPRTKQHNPERRLPRLLLPFSVSLPPTNFPDTLNGRINVAFPPPLPSRLFNTQGSSRTTKTKTLT